MQKIGCDFKRLRITLKKSLQDRLNSVPVFLFEELNSKIHDCPRVEIRNEFEIYNPTNKRTEKMTREYENNVNNLNEKIEREKDSKKIESLKGLLEKLKYLHSSWIKEYGNFKDTKKIIFPIL